jgi:hypothetical protein
VHEDAIIEAVAIAEEDMLTHFEGLRDLLEGCLTVGGSWKVGWMYSLVWSIVALAIMGVCDILISTVSGDLWISICASKFVGCGRDEGLMWEGRSAMRFCFGLFSVGVMLSTSLFVGVVLVVLVLGM